MPFLASNRSLLDAFRAGEPTALKEVYVRYAPGLSQSLRSAMPAGHAYGGFSFAGLNSPLELADALQEVFARAFSERSRLAYDGLSSYGAYLAGIGRNVVVDHLRRRGASRALAVELSGQAQTEPPVDSPEVAWEQAEAQRLVARFEATLNDRDRVVYQCRFKDGLTQQECAGQLKLTRIQVRRTEAKLRGQLLELLKTGGYLENAAPRAWGLAPRIVALFSRQRDP